MLKWSFIAVERYETQTQNRLSSPDSWKVEQFTSIPASTIISEEQTVCRRQQVAYKLWATMQSTRF